MALLLLLLRRSLPLSLLLAGHGFSVGRGFYAETQRGQLLTVDCDILLTLNLVRTLLHLTDRADIALAHTLLSLT